MPTRIKEVDGRRVRALLFDVSFVRESGEKPVGVAELVGGVSGRRRELARARDAR